MHSVATPRAGPQSAPKTFTAIPPTSGEPFASFHEAALFWFEFGLKVIPIQGGTKKPAVTWDSWLEELSPEKISAYWSSHPDHEVGCIAGDNLIVFDADSAASIAALTALESAHGVTPSMVVKTSKGEHHYYWRADETFAKSDSHSTEAYPDRIDVKTGRALVVLPPSTGKTVQHFDVHNVGDLAAARQDFVDAVFRHNGRQPPRRYENAERPFDPEPSTGRNLARLKVLLDCLDPDMGYEDWLHCGMAIWTESGGCDDGLALFDTWSGKGTKYPGRRAIETKWRSFTTDRSDPIAMGTVIKMVSDAGFDWIAVCDVLEPQFEVCEYVAVPSGEPAPTERNPCPNPLDRYSLSGMAPEIERLAVAQVPVLGQVALMGQATVFYAWPNTGKTLITLSLLIHTISRRGVDPSKVYYINVDDSSKGLAQKARIADEYGFHMLADGYQGFEAGKFLALMLEMIANDQARGIVIILDTLKKFTDLMDKKTVSEFTKIIRRFVLSGGTLIGLAHANKNLRDGNLVYAGTSDLRDDFDCAYTISPLSAMPEHGEKTVVFENIKRRGDVAQTAAYSYDTANGIEYDELVASVQPVDDMQLGPLKQAEAVRSDAEVIGAVEDCIRKGINTKMKLRDAVATRTRVSRATAVQIIKKYTGDDPSKHRWTFSVGNRGAQFFALLDSALPLPGDPVTPS